MIINTKAHHEQLDRIVAGLKPGEAVNLRLSPVRGGFGQTEYRLIQHNPYDLEGDEDTSSEN